MGNKRLAAFEPARATINPGHHSTVSKGPRCLENVSKRARILSSSHASSAPMTLAKDISTCEEKLLLKARDPFSYNSGYCSVCSSADVSQNKNGGLSGCKNCGANFDGKKIDPAPAKPECLSCNFGALNVHIQKNEENSKSSAKAAPTKTDRTDSKMSSKKEDAQVLRDIIYEFCENSSLTVRTAHYAVSIALGHLKHLKSCKPRGRKDKRRHMSHEEALLELASASLLISCRHFNNGITLRQVSKATEVQMADIVDRKRKIEQMTGRKEATDANNLQGIVTRACRVLMLPSAQADAVQKLAAGAMKLDEFHGMQCSTVVAGCIFFVALMTGANCSKDDIREATCVSWSSTRSTYKRLLRRAADLLPEATLRKRLEGYP